MSVINKMLQDLDARGVHAAPSDFLSVRPGSVLDARRRLEIKVLMVLAALVVLALIALAALAAWRFSAVAAAPVAVDKPVVPRATAAPVLVSQNAAPLEVAALPAAVGVVAPMPAPSLAKAAPPSAPSLAKAAPSEPRIEPRVSTPAPGRSAESRLKPERLERAERPDQPERSQRPMRTEQTVQQAAMAGTAARTPAVERSVRSAGSAATADNALQMKQANPRQEAENEYRRALGLVQEGRVTAGISGLEQTLRIFPRHDAARQTLVGLLLESRRPEEAMQQLEQGLALDAGQTAMAMTLARLQVERNGPALQTLQRSLPHALDNADYQSFIGALLQREQRHKESIEHYTAALRMNPKNGIWWMGLGISLQADQRLSDARVAFQRAKASGNLDGELPNFVDKKLQQLGR